MAHGGYLDEERRVTLPPLKKAGSVGFNVI